MDVDIHQSDEVRRIFREDRESKERVGAALKVNQTPPIRLRVVPQFSRALPNGLHLPVFFILFLVQFLVELFKLNTHELLGNIMQVCADDVFDAAVLDHHLLVVRVALGGAAGLDDCSHQLVDLQALPLISGEIKELSLLDQELNVSSLLNLVPIVVVFGGVGPGVYSGPDNPYLSIIVQILGPCQSGWGGGNGGLVLIRGRKLEVIAEIHFQLLSNLINIIIRFLFFSQGGASKQRILAISPATILPHCLNSQNWELIQTNRENKGKSCGFYLGLFLMRLTIE